MCGRFIYKLTWAEIVKLYRLMLDQPTRNSQQRYNICPTTTIDTVVSSEGKRALVPMRWGLIPYWWNKPLKEMRLANLLSCTIVITEPNKFVAEVHNRMPVILEAKDFEQWELSDAKDAAVLKKPADENVLQK
jgi:putative SOS response-associated peptidase YedK